MKNKVPAPYVSVRKFSLIVGVSDRAISKAIKENRFNDSILLDEFGEVIGVHPENGKIEWERNNPRPIREASAARMLEGSVGDEEDYTKSRALKEYYTAQIAKLDYEKRLGTLAEVTEIEKAWLKVIGSAKQKILAVPSKLKGRIPHLTLDDVADIEEELREALEDLSEVEIESSDD